MPLPTSHPTLRGPRLVLRSAAAGDAPAVFGIFSDPEVMRYWSGPPWTDPAQADQLFARDRASLAAGDALRWMVADPGDLVVGCVALFHHDTQSRRAEVGYLFGRASQGQGYATEAMGLLLDYAFGPLGLHRIEADTDPRNTRSLALLERLGFKREGLLRERWIVEGEICDTAWHGILAREWRSAPA